MPRKKAEVAVASQFTREGIPGMLEQVNEKIRQIKGGADKKPSTVGTSFPGVGEIRNITKMEDLIMLNGTITAKEAAYKKSVTQLKLSIKVPEFKIAGIAPKVWREDIKMRIQEVAYEDQLNKLEKVKSELEANLSADQKLANSLQKIHDIMNEE